MRVFCDSGVVVRYFVDDDPARSLAAARLIDGDDTVGISPAVLLEAIHVLSREYQVANPDLGAGLIRFLSRADVELLDADKGTTIAGIGWSLRHSARRIPDAVIAAAAEYARCDVIVTFDESFRSPSVPVRMI